jgi:hypothetical protein
MAPIFLFELFDDLSENLCLSEEATLGDGLGQIQCPVRVLKSACLPRDSARAHIELSFYLY